MKATTELLMPADVAREAEVTPATVRHWETTGKLRGVRTISGRRLFRREDVDEFLAQRVKRAAVAR